MNRKSLWSAEELTYVKNLFSIICNMIVIITQLINSSWERESVIYKHYKSNCWNRIKSRPSYIVCFSFVLADLEPIFWYLILTSNGLILNYLIIFALHLYCSTKHCKVTRRGENRETVNARKPGKHLMTSTPFIYGETKTSHYISRSVLSADWLITFQETRQTFLQ